MPHLIAIGTIISIALSIVLSVIQLFHFFFSGLFSSPNGPLTGAALLQSEPFGATACGMFWLPGSNLLMFLFFVALIFSSRMRGDIGSLIRMVLGLPAVQVAEKIVEQVAPKAVANVVHAVSEAQQIEARIQAEVEKRMAAAKQPATPAPAPVVVTPQAGAK